MARSKMIVSLGLSGGFSGCWGHTRWVTT